MNGIQCLRAVIKGLNMSCRIRPVTAEAAESGSRRLRQ